MISVQVLLFLFVGCYGKFQNIDDPEYLRGFVKYHCLREKECLLNGGPVCGFDEHVSYLAVFEDICTLHKANCRKAGIYSVVDMLICKTQQEFMNNFNDTMEFERIIRLNVDDRGRVINVKIPEDSRHVGANYQVTPRTLPQH